jgi:hypothetical protein
MLRIVYFVAFSLISINAQSSISTPQIDTTADGLAYFLLVLLFSIAYGVPVLMWMYRFYQTRIKDLANNKIEEIRQRVLSFEKAQISKMRGRSLSGAGSSVESVGGGSIV